MSKNTKGKILVVDDNDTMRDGIIKVVSKMGHDVKGASGGLEGLASFKKNSFDFVITDLKMADLDGLELLKRIKEINKTALVMIITAYGNVETAVEAMKLGAFDFITKPFPPEPKIQQVLMIINSFKLDLITASACSLDLP